MAQPEVNVEIHSKLLWLASKPKRIKIGVSGRGGMKSTGFGDLMLGFAGQGERICCTREFQNSIDDSVHELLIQEISRLGLEAQFDVMAGEIRAQSGGELFYKGLARNITSLKSLHGVHKLWIEEGESVSEKSLRVLTPSIRSSASDNVSELHKPPEIWISMNRGSSKDAVAKKYLARAEADLEKQGWYEDDLMMVVELNWRDNPWFPPELEQERQDDLKNLPRAEYDHIWEGAYSDSVENAIIRPEWFDACVDAHIKLGFEALGQERVAYDPADSGDDKAFGYAKGSVIIDIQSTTEGRIDTAADLATDFANDIRPDVFTWDADGMGLGLKRQFSDAFKGKKIDIEPFHGGHGVDHPGRKYEPLESEVKKAKTNKEMFTNKRAQYYWMLRDRMLRTYRAVEKGARVFDPDDLISISSNIEQLKALRAEICRIPREPKGSGRIQIMSKPDMKKKLDLDSPNMADVAMMLMREVEVSTKAKGVQLDQGGW